MKIQGILLIIVSIILLLTPMAALSRDADGETETAEYDLTEEDTEGAALSSAEDAGDVISVFMTASEETETIEMRDYVIGSVAAEMPASYELEALKAQALVSVTFAEYIKTAESNSTPGGADITDDSSLHQGYISTEEMKENWGDAFEAYYNRISQAADAVIDKVITYDGRPIMAAYHAISSGRTESAANIWQSDIPYLQSVESPGDVYSTRYSLTEAFSAEELKSALRSVSGVNTDDIDENFIVINGVTEAGTVTSVTVGGKEMTGTELRSCLNLRSPCFTAEYSEGEYLITVKGYGHGVGMSQYGADYYAKQGMTYEEIILHYYTGVEIERR